jgi:predicted ATPase/DNA-binding SARP family transcriptional activator
VLEVALLGPLRVAGREGELRLGGIKQRAVLALLAIRAGHVVSTDELVGAVWGESRREGSTRALQVYVSNLRKLLAQAGDGRPRISRRGPGYVLELDADELDLARFERLVAAGREALASGRVEDAGRLLVEGLALWRGRALADFAYEGWAQRQAARLEELRLAAIEDRIEADLELGQGAALVGEIEQLIVEHPYRERLRAQLMLALYRSGRQADALAAYQDARHVLVDELGIEPSADLRDLERQILSQDPALAAESRQEAIKLPIGTVTFVFTDVADSTKLLEELGADRFAEGLREHRDVIEAEVRRHGGTQVDTQGDAFFCVFPFGREAVAAVDAFQRRLTGRIRVRAGIHTGEALLDDGRYVGMDVHRTARIAAVGHGGQTVLSAATVAVLEPATVELRDLGEHRLKDLSAPIRLHQLGDAEFPPLKTLYRTNLPVPATPFLGRERELGEVTGLLARDDVRLLTLTGPGGTGKTRLGAQAAGMASGDYPDGVWWVSLAALRDPELVLPSAAQALDPRMELEEHIGSKRLLLVFDNFEHVVAAARDLAGLISLCPNLKLLATSREPLHVSGEQEYPVPPLDLEDAEGLFLARARAVEPEFDADEAVADICRRLDCLPLALELAAARVKALSSRQILERLDRRLPLLSGGARDLPERQRTLRATIQWSHELLTEDEKRLFARLAVFAGGCTLEAAEQVCDAELDTLESLLDKSLLRRTGERYWMLETIREYAAAQLEASGECGPVRDRHLEFVLGLASQLDAAYGIDAELLERFGHERDNFRAALTWASSTHQLDAQLDLVGRTSAFWANRGHLAEGRDWVDSAVLASAGEKTVRRAKVLLAGARFAARLGDVDRMSALAAESLDIARDVGDMRGVVMALNAVGHGALERDNFDEAERCFEEAAAGARELGDSALAALTINAMGDCALRQRDYARAVPLFEESLAISREVGEGEGIAVGLYNLAHALFRVGRMTEAESAARESLELAVRIESKHAAVWVLVLLSAAERLRGETELAATLLGVVQAQCERMGLELRGAEASLHSEAARGLEADLGQSRYAAAIGEGRAMSLEQAVAYALGESTRT